MGLIGGSLFNMINGARHAPTTHRHPDEAAPADVVPGTVVHDVDGAQVPRLPPEELQ